MSSYCRLLYHVIWSPKYRDPVMIKSGRPQMLAYMAGALKNQGCYLYGINAVEDHLHILTSIPHTKLIPRVIGELKRSTSIWIKANEIFPDFERWQTGYGIFTVSHYEKKKIKRYIANQEEHHRKKSFEEEYIRILREHNIDFEYQYLWV